MVVSVTPEQERGSITEDYVDKVLGPRSLDSLAIEHRFFRRRGGLAAEALKTLFKIEKLDAGYVVAMRGLMPAGQAGGAARWCSSRSTPTRNTSAPWHAPTTARSCPASTRG